LKITEQEVRRVADLANLALRDDEVARMALDLSGILTHIDKLNELDTSNVPPTTQVGEVGTPMRDDKVTNPSAAEQMLANAPSRERNYFKVPKIIE
jgi:aspartyl-tRNA(Asn)/glutamyl-tRNA(Gln) amidotransferase subunit C